MKKIAPQHFFLIILFLAILPYAYLYFFANPVADDFSLSGQARNNELLHLIYHNYFFWNGRYFSNILIYLNPLVYGSYGAYKMVLFILFLMFFWCNYLLINQCFYSESYLNKVIIALTLSLLFLHNMSIISEGIYWFTGTVIYFFGLITSVFYSALLIKTIRKKKKKTRSILLVTLLFFVCGFNEVLSLLVVFLLGTASYVFYKNNLLGKNIVRTQFIFALFFTGIMLLAPGNEARTSTYENTHQFVHAFSYSIMQVGRFSLLWIFSIPLIAASFLYFSIHQRLILTNSFFKNSFYLNRWVSLFILFGITFLCVFPAYWATGILGQHRTLNVAYFFFIILWFINLTAWYNHYKERLHFKLTTKITTTLAAFLFIGLLLTGNGFNALVDVLSGRAKTYNQQMIDRYTILKGAKTQKKQNIQLQPITAKPKCLFISDITNNHQDWTNQAYNLYFQLNSSIIFVEKE